MAPASAGSGLGGVGEEPRRRGAQVRMRAGSCPQRRQPQAVRGAGKCQGHARHLGWELATKEIDLHEFNPEIKLGEKGRT